MPVHPSEYSPPAMLTTAPVLMPVILTVFEICTDNNGMPDCKLKRTESGVVSQSVVTLKLRGTPAMVTVADVVVLQLTAAVWRTVTDWPALIVPDRLVKAAESIR